MDTRPENDRPPRSPGGLLPLVTLPTSSAIDPVCGMTVDPATAPASLVHEGRTWYFCCPRCAERFRADPGKYTGAAPAPSPPAAPVEGAVYTCPMHPEVVSDHPGSCPKCGMALEPRTVSADEAPNPELLDMSRRFWVGLALSVPVFVLGWPT